MSLLEKMFSNESFKKSIFSRLAKQAKAQGLKKLIITIKDNGEFDAEAVGDDMRIVSKTTYEFLLNFYEKNKPSPDTIKTT